MPTYSGEFKQTVVEDLRKNHLSYGEARRKYGIAGAIRFRNGNVFTLRKDRKACMSNVAEVRVLGVEPGKAESQIRIRK